jgi:hypothetical protein
MSTLEGEGADGQRAHQLLTLLQLQSISKFNGSMAGLGVQQRGQAGGQSTHTSSRGLQELHTLTSHQSHLTHDTFGSPQGGSAPSPAEKAAVRI